MDKIDWVAVIIALGMVSPVFPSLVEGIREVFSSKNSDHSPDL